jgi:cytochrome c biogenesis protein CcmG/thiol:disulfide interchange protein DsbE
VRRALVLAALAAITFLFAACGGGGLGEGGAGAATTPVAERGAAPAFRVPALEGGGEIALADYRGVPVVLNFWASWCGPCRDEMPALVEFADANPGLRVVGLAVNDRPEDSRRFAGDLGVDFDLGVDRDGDVAASYGATGLPVTVVIDAEGRVATTWFGPITRNDLDLFTRGLGA